MSSSSGGRGSTHVITMKLFLYLFVIHSFIHSLTILLQIFFWIYTKELHNFNVSEKENNRAFYRFYIHIHTLVIFTAIYNVQLLLLTLDRCWTKYSRSMYSDSRSGHLSCKLMRYYWLLHLYKTFFLPNKNGFMFFFFWRFIFVLISLETILLYCCYM